MAAKRKRTRKSEPAVSKSARALHRVILKDADARRRLYESIGRVRCYLYKYGKSTPKPETQKKIQKLTKGVVAAPWS